MRFIVPAAAIIAALATFQIVRNAVVQEDEPMELGSLLWPGHPDVLRAVAMRDVGEAAARGQVPPRSTIEALASLARSAPRAPDPYLVQGALAMKQGDANRSQRLLLQALRRDPRSTAGHVLLADLYLKSGRTADGYVELARLTRIEPTMVGTVSGALEQFVRSGGTGSQLRRVFKINPALENPVLTELASDPANADLILAVASRPRGEDAATPPLWQEKLLNAMIGRRQYRKAYQVWLQLAGVQRSASRAVFNPHYRSTLAPPPFDWTFTSSGAGQAEGENGYLHVIHDGQANAVLAKQILLLAPGRYHLETSSKGTLATEYQLIWSISCLPSGTEVLAAGVRPAAGGLRVRFEIPHQACEAQRLELKGRAQEPVELADVLIGPIRIERAAA